MTSPFPPTLSELPGLVGPILQHFPTIRRAYVFGSVADGTAGPASDLDIALVCSRGQSRIDYITLGYDVYARLSTHLRNDRIEVVVMNATDSSELRYAVVTDGKIVFDRGDDLDQFEMQIRHEYFDHRQTLVRLGIR